MQRHTKNGPLANERWPLYHVKNVYVNTATANTVDEKTARFQTRGGVQEQFLKALGLRIRELRSKQGYSQEGFADRCGVHRTFMGTVERGESNLSFHNLVKISAALGVTLSRLLSGVEQRAARLSDKP